MIKDEKGIYKPVPGIHLVVINSRDLTYASYEFPDSWQTWETLEQVELVACLEVERIKVKSCQYKKPDGGKATKTTYRYDTKLQLLTAHNAEVIAVHTFHGSELGCPVIVEANDILEGDKTPVERIIAFLQPLIEVP